MATDAADIRVGSSELASRRDVGSGHRTLSRGHLFAQHLGGRLGSRSAMRLSNSVGLFVSFA